MTYALCRSLHHPNILTCVGILREDGKIVILTNYVKGKNLFQLIHTDENKVTGANATTDKCYLLFFRLN
jgi:serine/threonine protein kinase